MPESPPSPPPGVHSDYAPPIAPPPDPIRDTLARFDREVAHARNQPSKVLIALRSAELVEQELEESLRAAFARLKYECYPRSEGGLGLSVTFQRTPHAAAELEALRCAANRLLSQKRAVIAEGR